VAPIGPLAANCRQHVDWTGKRRSGDGTLGELSPTAEGVPEQVKHNDLLFWSSHKEFSTMNKNLIKGLSVAAFVVMAAGCASNSSLDEVRATAAAAQKSADEAKQSAANAERVAGEAQSTANQALQTANDAKTSADEANTKIDRSFKKSMYK
jgi:murein lipoprotein